MTTDKITKKVGFFPNSVQANAVTPPLNLKCNNYTSFNNFSFVVLNLDYRFLKKKQKIFFKKGFLGMIDRFFKNLMSALKIKKF